MNSELIIVLTTTPNMEVAEKLARGAIEQQLAACVNILPQIKSIYRWNGAIQSDSEQLLLIKSLTQNLDQLRSYIIANHPYEVPELVVLNADGVDPKYLSWAQSAVQHLGQL